MTVAGPFSDLREIPDELHWGLATNPHYAGVHARTSAGSLYIEEAMRAPRMWGPARQTVFCADTPTEAREALLAFLDEAAAGRIIVTSRKGARYGEASNGLLRFSASARYWIIPHVLPEYLPGEKPWTEEDEARADAFMRGEPYPAEAA